MVEVMLAVNGGLMRGMRSNAVLVDAGGTFRRTARTVPRYRLWSIEDRFPAMVQVGSGGASIEVEVWSLSGDGFATVLDREPRGLSVAKVELDDGEVVLGVVGEPVVCEGQQDITSYGGWRSYLGASSP